MPNDFNLEFTNAQCQAEGPMPDIEYFVLQQAVSAAQMLAAANGGTKPKDAALEVVAAYLAAKAALTAADAPVPPAPEVGA